jgi:general secretion pathway protein E/type IV pilus assembly protein PilB
MQVEPFLVASTLEAVMGQRLLRVLCPDCREPYEPSPIELPDDFPADRLGSDGKIYRPRGCRACQHLGYRGRVGLFELLVTTEAIRRLAHDRANTWTIQKQAREDGMMTMREDGWEKVLAGTTTIDEVVRVTKENPY